VPWKRRPRDAILKSIIAVKRRRANASINSDGPILLAAFELPVQRLFLRKATPARADKAEKGLFERVNLLHLNIHLYMYLACKLGKEKAFPSSELLFAYSYVL